MTTLQNIIEHLEVDITNKTLHNGKKNPNKNKYYWFRNEYYIVQLSGNDTWCIMSSNHRTRELLAESVWHCTAGYTSSRRGIFHRIITDCPDDMQVDHINRRRYDNRIDNIRQVTQAENMLNKSIYASNTSGKCGVYRKHNKRDNLFLWIGQINVEGTSITKAFSVKKYGGDERAKQMAIDWRKQQEQQNGYLGE